MGWYPEPGRFIIALGERHVSSSLAAIIIATVPLLVALMALRFGAAENPAGTRAPARWRDCC